MIRTTSTADANLASRAARAVAFGNPVLAAIQFGVPLVVGVATVVSGVLVGETTNSLPAAFPIIVIGITLICLGVTNVALPYLQTLTTWKRFAPRDTALMAEFGPAHIMFMAGGITTTVDMTSVATVAARRDMLAVRTTQSISLLIPMEMVPPTIAATLLSR
ncbi:hypothetical protein ABLE92_12630 [Gordonia sp. VNQ95]|uniref:hypothetical protein n=1 Tax=Gordonia TaxID=2053 RepID=UPI0032B39A2C